MTTMAKAFSEQLTDTNIISLPFEDRFGLIVDQEWTSRKNNHLKRLIKQAKFSDTGACVEGGCIFNCVNGNNIQYKVEGDNKS